MGMLGVKFSTTRATTPGFRNSSLKIKGWIIIAFPVDRYTHTQAHKALVAVLRFLSESPPKRKW